MFSQYNENPGLSKEGWWAIVTRTDSGFYGADTTSPDGEVHHFPGSGGWTTGWNQFFVGTNATGSWKYDPATKQAISDKGGVVSLPIPDPQPVPDKANMFPESYHVYFELVGCAFNCVPIMCKRQVAHGGGGSGTIPDTPITYETITERLCLNLCYVGGIINGILN